MTIATAPANLLDLLRQQAHLRPDAPAVIYLGDGEDIKAQVTFADLDTQARAIAARLQGLGAAGECVVLVYPPGLEFIAAFFGCIYANVIPVPLPLPHSKGTVAQFPGIVADLDARILMTTAMTMTRLRRMDLHGVEALVCLNTEDTQPELARAWRPSTPGTDSTAYLQYTSGSTANRKGVVIRHDNVIAHLNGMAECFRHHSESVSVNWLPHTHDLGLVSGILQPLYHGHLNVLMSPNAFVQQPIRWLNAITRFRGTYSNSPNFGYDHCVRRTTAEQRSKLDLRPWLVALNGAEPVHHRTIDEFVDAFEPYGFQRNAMYPAYGLAEATLMVSGGVHMAPRVSIGLDTEALEQNRIVETTARSARTLVGCGQPLPHTSVRIVDPVTCVECGADQVGEIWVRGPGVTAGYWRRPDENAETFGGRVAGTGDGEPYLRTGDLGFLRRNELFITGRWKDLVIIRGANHYPQDIEWTIERCHPAFRQGCGGAFSVDSDEGEQLVIVYELEREYLKTLDFPELARIARRAVAEEHDVRLHTLVLLKTGTVPRTTSGKIQRRKCRADFLNGELSEVWRSSDEPAEEEAASSAPPPSVAPATSARSASDIVEFLRTYAEDRLNSRLMDERRSISPHVILDFGNQGILGLQAPREYGGLALGYGDTLRVIEQLGAIDQTLTMMTIVHNSLGIWPIVQYAEPTLKADLVPRLAAGRELVAFAITEPGAGSNPQALSATAAPDGQNAWLLRGQKSWSGTAGWASVINVFAQNVDSTGEGRGVNGFVVPRGAKGLRIGPEALTLGMRGMVQNTIYLEDVRVRSSDRLGEIGDGMKVAHAAMMQGRLAIGAACVGGMKRCLQLLVRYAAKRNVSTGLLIENPVLLDRAAAVSSALAGIESLVSCAAERFDAAGDVPSDVLVVCKIAGSEWFCRAADDLVQFLGGRGYIETNIAAQLLRDARVTRILEGPSEALTMFLGSRVIHDGGALHGFIRDHLRAPAVSARLADAALDIHDRCTSGSDSDGVDARRWAYALIGRIATEAVLFAATTQRSDASAVERAEHRFEAAIASVRQEAALGPRLSSEGLMSLVDGYSAAIGDVEQSLSGEDHDLDAMLRRDVVRPMRAQAAPSKISRTHVTTVEHDVEVSAVPPVVTTASPVPATAGASANRAPATEGDIERFVVKRIAAALKMREASVDASRTFFDYGLDSVTTVMLVASLEEWLGIVCNPEIVYEIPNIRRFAAHIAQRQHSR